MLTLYIEDFDFINLPPGDFPVPILLSIHSEVRKFTAAYLVMGHIAIIFFCYSISGLRFV